MRWYTIYMILPDGRRDLQARITCKSDAEAADTLTASMFPEAHVYEGARHVATLPPLRQAMHDEDVA